MFRYFAWMWDTADPQHTQAVPILRERLQSLSSQWRAVIDRPGLQLFIADECAGDLAATALSGDAGAILGSLYERHADPLNDAPMRRARLGPAETQAIVASRGDYLIENCWGNYVALLRDSTEPAAHVVLSPTGSVPCLLAGFQGMPLVFSCISDCLGLRLLRLTYSPIYMRDRVLGRHDELQDPVFGITRLCRAERICIRPHEHRARFPRGLCWQPLSFAETAEPLEDPDYAARAVRSTVRACTRTLVSNYNQVLLRLSGGLDSSIIAGCLGDDSSGRTITCHTYFNPRRGADVHPWARLVAQHCGFEHEEIETEPADMNLRTLAHLRPSVDVVQLLEYAGRSVFERRLSQARGAAPILTGDGGDSGFCSDSIALALVEHLKRHGMSPHLLLLAAQVSLHTHRSTWHVLVTSLRRWRFGCRLGDQKEARLSVSKLVAPDVLALAQGDQRYEHPWFCHRLDVPWATIRRMGMLTQPHHFYDLSIDPQAAAPELLHPLYAQPVVELLLRIPLYVHFEAGRDRGLARRAFASDVPQPILQRLWKDRAPGHLDELVARHRPWLREFFLDGLLVTSGLLQRAAVDAALSNTVSKSNVNPAELLRHLEIELWARRWTEHAANVSIP